MPAARSTDPRVAVAFGARLREERKRLGLTQSQVASAAGISAPTQVGYEKGYRTPDLNYETAIEAVGFDARYVRTGVREGRHSEALDWDHLTVAYEIVQSTMQEREIVLGPRATIEATRLVYELSLDDPGSVDRAAGRVLKLVVSRQ